MDITNFKCRRCGKCCEWPGVVKLTAEEVDLAAACLGLETREFLERYTRLNASRTGLVLTDGPSGACVFHEASPSACRINAAKPAQCRDFPLRWRTPGWELICEGAMDIDKPAGAKQ